MTHPPDEEAVETLLGPLSWTPRQANTLTKASVLKFCEDDFEPCVVITSQVMIGNNVPIFLNNEKGEQTIKT